MKKELLQQQTERDWVLQEIWRIKDTLSAAYGHDVDRLFADARNRQKLSGLDPTKGHEQAGQRPVLILSHEVFNHRSGTVIAMALTSQPQRAGFPLTLELDAANLPKKSWVKISQIRTLSVERLSGKIGREIGRAHV